MRAQHNDAMSERLNAQTDTNLMIVHNVVSAGTTPRGYGEMRTRTHRGDIEGEQRDAYGGRYDLLPPLIPLYWRWRLLLLAAWRQGPELGDDVRYRRVADERDVVFHRISTTIDPGDDEGRGEAADPLCVEWARLTSLSSSRVLRAAAGLR